MKLAIDTAIDVRIYVEDGEVTGIDPVQGWHEPNVCLVDEDGSEADLNPNSDLAGDALAVLTGRWKVEVA